MLTKDLLLSLARPASVNTGRTYFPMKFATEEQAARRKGQMVNVMHRWLHVESYEIFMKEVEVDEDDEGLGEVEKGGAA